VEIFWSEKLRLPYKLEFQAFLNGMSKRIAQGKARYGDPNRDKKYLDRLLLEAKAYKKTGNMEHLINVANYAWLESVAPQNRKFHFDNAVDSATRGRV